jgi:hypothetical protein
VEILNQNGDIMRLFAVLALTAILSACGASKDSVIQPLSDDVFDNPRYAIQQEETSVEVPQKFVFAFEASLMRRLGEEGFSFGDSEKTLVYRFVDFDEGSRALRYFVGLGAGSSKMTVEVEFRDAEGRVRGQVRSQGVLGMGFLGGEGAQAADAAAEGVVEEIEKFRK